MNSLKTSCGGNDPFENIRNGIGCHRDCQYINLSVAVVADGGDVLNALAALAVHYKIQKCADNQRICCCLLCETKKKQLPRGARSNAPYCAHNFKNQQQKKTRKKIVQKKN